MKNGHYLLIKVEQHTKANESVINVMDLECIFGRIKQNTKGIERMTKRMAMGRFIMLMEMYLKGIGLMIKLVDLGCINILVGLLMKVSEKMIYRRDMVLRPGRMDRNLRGII